MKFNLNNLCFSLLFIYSNCSPVFYESWVAMQKQYLDLVEQLNLSHAIETEKTLCHNDWIQNKKHIRAVILGDPNENFLRVPAINGTMVREDFGNPQRYEIDYIKTKISSTTKAKITTYKDPVFGNIAHACTDFDCTINTLAHLYYAAIILEKLKNQFDPIITEFGSGYGSLARIFKSIMPNSTLILIDLPELLVLQYLFFKETSPTVPVVIHSKLPIIITPNAINLVPVFLAHNINTDSDVFISTFGISETTQACQEMVINKKFFNANLCYLAGQMPHIDNNYVHHSILHNAVYKNFNHVINQPAHAESSGHKLYEITGFND